MNWLIYLPQMRVYLHSFGIVHDQWETTVNVNYAARFLSYESVKSVVDKLNDFTSMHFKLMVVNELDTSIISVMDT